MSHRRFYFPIDEAHSRQNPYSDPNPDDLRPRASLSTIVRSEKTRKIQRESTQPLIILMRSVYRCCPPDSTQPLFRSYISWWLIEFGDSHTYDNTQQVYWGDDTDSIY